MKPKLLTVNMKDIKERLPWVMDLVRRNGFVLITNRGRLCATLHSASESMFSIDPEALAKKNEMILTAAAN